MTEFSYGPALHTPGAPPWNCAPNSPSQTARDTHTSKRVQPTHTDTNAASPPQSPTADTATETPSPDPPPAPTPDMEIAAPPPAIISRLGRRKFWRCSKNCSLPNHRPPRAPVPANSIAGSTSKPNAPACAAGPAQTNWLPTPAKKPPPKPPAMPCSKGHPIFHNESLDDVFRTDNSRCRYRFEPCHLCAGRRNHQAQFSRPRRIQ